MANEESFFSQPKWKEMKRNLFSIMRQSAYIKIRRFSPLMLPSLSIYIVLLLSVHSRSLFRTSIPFCYILFNSKNSFPSNLVHVITIIWTVQGKNSLNSFFQLRSRDFLRLCLWWKRTARIKLLSSSSYWVC